MPYEQAIERLRRVEAMYHKKKKPDGLKRHHDQRKPEKVLKSERRPRNNQILNLMEQTIHILNKYGWKTLIQKVTDKLFKKSEIKTSEQAKVQSKRPDPDMELEE